MDYTHVLAFLAPYLPTVGTFLKEMFQQWLNAKYPKEQPLVIIGKHDGDNPFRKPPAGAAEFPP